MKETLGKSRRRFIQSLAVATQVGWRSQAQGQTSPTRFPSLDEVGDDFRVVLIADTQVGPADAKGVVPATSQRKMSAMVEEINAMTPAPALIVFDGDQVENVDQRKVDNFLARAKVLKPLSILVHGNHDGVHPYAEFRAMQKIMNGTEEVYFSWDIGRWHFATIPTNLPNDDYAREVLDWLATDLKEHRDRPTMVFPHYHLMPQGLSQLEWYTYDRSFRLACYDLFARMGNVRYSIGGHVHNGIQTSLKTAWTYRGTNYLVAPTCTASRNFGEDFPPFAAGLPQGPEDSGGGYYMVMDFAGDSVTLKGRLVGVPEEFTYPNSFPIYKDQDPLWLNDITALPLPPTHENGTFDAGLAHWQHPFRYTADHDPGFVVEAQTPEGASQQAVYLACREKGQHWARDEEVEIFQRCGGLVPTRPTFSFRFHPRSSTRSGGGYARISLYRQRELVMTLLIDWLRGKKDRNTRMGINSLYTSTGVRGVPDSFIRLGKERKAIFWTLEPDWDTWNTLACDLPQVVDRSLGEAGRYSALRVDEMLLALGVWCLEDPGSQAATWFDDVAWTTPLEAGISLNGQGLPVDDRVFATDFGRQTLSERENEKRRRKSKPVA